MINYFIPLLIRIFQALLCHELHKISNVLTNNTTYMKKEIPHIVGIVTAMKYLPTITSYFEQPPGAGPWGTRVKFPFELRISSNCNWFENSPFVAPKLPRPPRCGVALTKLVKAIARRANMIRAILFYGKLDTLKLRPRSNQISSDIRSKNANSQGLFLLR
jgi:hypothetical protein